MGHRKRIQVTAVPVPKQSKNREPEMVKGYGFGEILNDAIKKAENAPPPTPEQIEERNRLLNELYQSQGPGDALMVFGVSRKKK